MLPLWTRFRHFMYFATGVTLLLALNKISTFINLVLIFRLYLSWLYTRATQKISRSLRWVIVKIYMSPYSFQFRVYSICKTKTHHLSPYKKVNLGGVLVVLLTLENKVNTKLGLEFDNNLPPYMHSAFFSNTCYHHIQVLSHYLSNVCVYNTAVSTMVVKH